MDTINFNIRISNNLTFDNFILLSKQISNLYNPKQLFFEYTLGQKNIDTTFLTYSEFDSFYNHDIRFDLLKLEKDNVFIGFQQSQVDLRVFGKTKNKSIIYTILDLLDGNIVFAYIHNDFDLTLSRTKNYRSWKRKLKEIPPYIGKVNNPQSISERDKYLIDLETVPTHYHQISNGDKLWFGACSEMYFSDLYYKYISEDMWNSFNKCLENKILDNGIRKVVLYEDTTDYDLPKNRQKQWDFRNDLNIDNVAHELMGNRAFPH